MRRPPSVLRCGVLIDPVHLPARRWLFCFFVWRSVLFCAGVSSYEVSLEKQEVLVNGTIGYEDLLEKIKKTGKEVRVPRCVRGSWVC